MRTKYRLLRKGERVKIGDEYHFNDERWDKVTDLEEVDERWNPKTHWPVRRKVKKAKRTC